LYIVVIVQAEFQ